MCHVCDAHGFRECDSCGGPTWPADDLNPQNRFRVDGRLLCGYCAPDRSVPALERHIASRP